MNQLETLFETGSPAWRVEIRIKAGGGPFDPAGFSIQVIDSAGQLIAMEVVKVSSAPRPAGQADELANKAVARLTELLASDLQRESSEWHGR